MYQNSLANKAYFFSSGTDTVLYLVLQVVQTQDVEGKHR